MNFVLTAMGWIVVPCTLALVIFRRDLLLPWAAFVSVFQAASALNVTLANHFLISIQPAFFVAAVSCCVLIAFPLSGEARWRHVRPLRSVYIPLGIFAGYAWFSSYWIVLLFTDQIYVGSPRSRVAEATLLTFSGTNVNQDIDLALALALFAVVCESIYMAHSRRLWSNITNGWMAGGVLASVVGLYQIVGGQLGLSYPSEFFNSNTVYSQQFNASFAGLHRLSGTFSEPSVAALYLSAIFGYALFRFIYGSKTTLVWLSMLLCGVALLLTTSTTAYLTLSIVFVMAAYPALARVRLSPKAFLSAMLLAALLTVGASVLIVHKSATGRVIADTLLNKTAGGSYTARMDTIQSAWALSLKTTGLGVGWGSARAESLPVNILVNSGVIGFIAFIWAMVMIVKINRRNGPLLLREMQVERSGLMVALAAMAIAGTLAVPDLMVVPAWILLALSAGLGARTQALRGAAQYRAEERFFPSALART